MWCKNVESYSGLIGFIFTFALVFVGWHALWLSSFGLGDYSACLGGVFSFDVVSYYLFFLSFLVWVSLWFWFSAVSNLCKVLISLSVLSSILCFCCVHALWFWVFYEMSIVPLLVLLVLDSPYSERFVATWYLGGYIVLTSLPMLLCLFFLCELWGSFDVRFWCFFDDGYNSTVLVYILLGVLFMTKIPLPPFHVWLPLVHAEASSPVSVCLSGFIMKLGILGVTRFCGWILPFSLFSMYYVVFCLFLGVSFFLCATRELDGKRWLAFMSLCHIMIPACCLSSCSFEVVGVSFLYCFGHGLSAGVVFLLLWWLYGVSGTRNLLILKSGVGGSKVFSVLLCASMCTVCSLPPTMQFFCEVFVLQDSAYYSVLYCVVLFFYLFMGGLLPLFLVGGIISRHYDFVVGASYLVLGIFSLVLLLLWSFLFFVVA